MFWENNACFRHKPLFEFSMRLSVSTCYLTARSLLLTVTELPIRVKIAIMSSSLC